jgi:uncharacterized membrane protein YqjE
MTPRDDTQDDIRVEDDRSVGGLMSRMASDLGNLVRKEIELAKLETKEEVSQAGKAGAQFGVAGLSAYMSLFFVSIAAALVLDHFMPSPVAFAIVGVLYAIAAYVFATRGRKQTKELRTLPETKQTIQEDVTWVKTRNS